jgi:hypothetical protein
VVLVQVAVLVEKERHRENLRRSCIACGGLEQCGNAEEGMGQGVESDETLLCVIKAYYCQDVSSGKKKESH